MVSKEDIEFQQEPDMDVVCPICLHVVMDNPCQTLCCGRHFCGTCISRVESQKKACPNCRGECKTFPDKNFERTIGSKVVYCRKKGKTTEECCDWRGELKHYREHTSTDCLYEKVECPLCSQCTEPRLRINIEECPFRPYECQYCGRLAGETYAFITNEHYQYCDNYPVGCTKCSNKEVTRAEYLPHVINNCPMQPVECLYSWLGCKEEPKRKDAKKHYSDAHTLLLHKLFNNLREDTKEMKSHLNELRNQVRCELNHRQGDHLIVQQSQLEETAELKTKDSKLVAKLNRKYFSLQRDHDKLRNDFNQLHYGLCHHHLALKARHDKMLKYVIIATCIIATVVAVVVVGTITKNYHDKHLYSIR